MRLNNVLAFALMVAFTVVPMTDAIGQNVGTTRDREVKTRFDQVRPTDQLDFEDRTSIRGIERAILDREIDPETYIIGPGDVFYFNISSVERIDFFSEVTPTGDLPLSRLGIVNVSRLTLAEAVERVRSYVGELLPGAEVHTSLYEIRKMKVFVFGAVPEPGQYDVYASDRLHDLLSLTSLRQLAQVDEITITRLDGSVIQADMIAYRHEGNMDSNPTLQAGDVIYVPFTQFSESVVRISGDINYPGYRVLRTNENYGQLFRRTVEVKNTSDLTKVVLIRNSESGEPINTDYTLSEISELTPIAGDEVQILTQRSVSVHGFVGDPGSFVYIPGFTSGEYVTLAGGLLPFGSMRKLRVTREDGTVHFGESIVIQRGDVIEVPKSLRGYILGDLSLVAIITSTASVALTAYAVITR